MDEKVIGEKDMNDFYIKCMEFSRQRKLSGRKSMGLLIFSAMRIALDVGYPVDEVLDAFDHAKERFILLKRIKNNEE